MRNSEEIHFLPSTLETVDGGLYRWLDETLNLHTKTNNGIYKVPVLWLGSERAWQIKNDQRIRDKVGKLILPLITINRNGVVKDPNFKGIFQANIYETQDYRGGAVPADRRINQDKTQNFQNNIASRATDNEQQTGKNSENNQIVYDTFNSPIPVHVVMNYSITLRTEFQQQMNDILQPFITTTGQINSFLFTKDGHRYEGFVQQDFSFSNNTTNLAEEERMFETKVDIKVLAYLVGEGYNRNKRVLSKRENAVRVRITNERRILADKVPWKKKDDDYRE